MSYRTAAILFQERASRRSAVARRAYAEGWEPAADVALLQRDADRQYLYARVAMFLHDHPRVLSFGDREVP